MTLALWITFGRLDIVNVPRPALVTAGSYFLTFEPNGFLQQAIDTARSQQAKYL